MATQFLQSDQATSDIINPGGVTRSGAVLIAFFGAMDADEKWQIEQRQANPAGEWVAVHATDFIAARGMVGTAASSPTVAPVNLWAGPRPGNRVFEVPIGDGFEYRARLVFKNNSQTSLTNSTVTACWAEAKTKQWL